MELKLDLPTHKATTIIVVYDDGCVEQCPISKLDGEYRDLVVEDVAHYVNVRHNKSLVDMLAGSRD